MSALVEPESIVPVHPVFVYLHYGEGNHIKSLQVLVYAQQRRQRLLFFYQIFLVQGTLDSNSNPMSRDTVKNEFDFNLLHPIP